MTDIEILEREVNCRKRRSSINCTNCNKCDFYVDDREILDAHQQILQILKEKGPCDFCMHSPPSSFGGKPCSYCPAQKRSS